MTLIALIPVDSPGEGGALGQRSQQLAPPPLAPG
jgi:hypothetical protein